MSATNRASPLRSSAYGQERSTRDKAASDARHSQQQERQYDRAPVESHTDKRRKRAADFDDLDTTSAPTRACTDCERLQLAGLDKDKRFLAAQKELIELKQALNAKDATILGLKHKIWDNDAANKKILADTEIELQGQREKVTRKNEIINNMLVDNNELKIYNRDFKSKVDRLTDEVQNFKAQQQGLKLEHQSQLHRMNRDYQSLRSEHQALKADYQQLQSQVQIPDTYQEDVKLEPESPPRDTPENRRPFSHPYAPRERRMYGPDFRPRRFYPTGTGAVWPRKYGSNASWDLGLCQAHFSYPEVCSHGRACDYRHEPLTRNERSYIQTLVPDGPEFIRMSDHMTHRKEG